MPEVVGFNAAINQETSQGWVRAKDADEMNEARGHLPKAGVREQFVNSHGELDQRLQAGLAGDAQEGRRLPFCENQSGGVGTTQFVEALAHRELLAEIERVGCARDAHCLKEELAPETAEE